MAVIQIAAMARNRAIGLDNKLLWRLPSEMAHFKQTTMGKTVLMGRKTFESLGRPLPNRRNVVLSREMAQAPEGCELVRSVEEALRNYNNGVYGEDLMVIGGANIYAQLLPFTHTIVLTEVEADFEADAFFPALSEHEWKVSSRDCRSADEKNAYDFCILTYDRMASH
ncbi:dihydrofolate reductase [Paenibacillus aurantiacus]|uniref:Dihydrofolate reductase n=1 Tax=Paenibacillus aurantiacus TaxID=1936118 RepID=A0ABV5KYX6_9BACL